MCLSILTHLNQCYTVCGTWVISGRYDIIEKSLIWLSKDEQIGTILCNQFCILYNASMGTFRREFSRNLWNGAQIQTRSNFVFRVKCPSLLLDRNQSYMFQVFFIILQNPHGYGNSHIFKIKR